MGRHKPTEQARDCGSRLFDLCGNITACIVLDVRAMTLPDMAVPLPASNLSRVPWRADKVANENQFEGDIRAELLSLWNRGKRSANLGSNGTGDLIGLPTVEDKRAESRRHAARVIRKGSSSVVGECSRKASPLHLKTLSIDCKPRSWGLWKGGHVGGKQSGNRSPDRGTPILVIHSTLQGADWIRRQQGLQGAALARGAKGTTEATW